MGRVFALLDVRILEMSVDTVSNCPIAVVSTLKNRSIGICFSPEIIGSSCIKRSLRKTGLAGIQLSSGTIGSRTIDTINPF
jgi:hypothetical protein